MIATPPLISHVSDTARWVAFYRAMESERPDAHFRDPFARRLAGDKGEAIARGMKKGLTLSWPMVVRTAVMDEIILRTISERDIDTVVNLAAGLDTRPWRLRLPPTLRWIDVDLPAMLDLKLGELRDERPVCLYEGVRLDLSEVDARLGLFTRVNASARHTLVISEGLLIYLTPELVEELARDLHVQPSFTAWLIDLASPGLVTMLAKSWGRAVAAGNAPFRFAPETGTQFFEPAGWREVEWRSVFHEGIRLNRTIPLAKFWRWFGSIGRKRRERMERFSGIALLER
jgi:methyltransferase (TIGR00027 family)